MPDWVNPSDWIMERAKGGDGTDASRVRTVRVTSFSVRVKGAGLSAEAGVAVGEEKEELALLRG